MTKPHTPEMQALWDSRQWYECSLLTFAGGNLGANVLRYCSGDQDVVGADGQTYSCGGIDTGPYFDSKSSKAKVHTKVGLQVDTLTLEILPLNAQLFGVPFAYALASQILDGAELTIDTAYMPTWGNTSVGTLRKFVGRVADIDFGRGVIGLTINSHLELFNGSFPANVFSAACGLSLGDTGCGVLLDGGSVV
ncbi:MAG TPA: DUF2163 domain-containing protein, partial [Acetobacteraceae bacterium]|nr:DUF2163 domain-containing protein [Acetobacteraceae bacterium]